MSLGPFELTGQAFLGLYTALLVAAVVASLVIPVLLRPQRRRQCITDVDLLAYLTGGESRFTDALVARLLAARSLRLFARKRFIVDSTVNTDSPAEQSLLSLVQPIEWREIELALESHRYSIKKTLISAGLLMTDGERSHVRFCSVLPYFALMIFGATKLLIGTMADRPVDHLATLLVATGLLASARWSRVDRRTAAGRAVVTRQKDDFNRLRRAPTDREVGLAVALFGTAVLAASALSDFHRMRRPIKWDVDIAFEGGGGCGGCGG
jgi:uncharacterized protein (TIGR04222 family)